MNAKELLERLRVSATTLAQLKRSEKTATGSVGFLLGANYALQRAVELRFNAGDIDDATYADELRRVAGALGGWNDVAAVEGTRWGRARETHAGLWLAGFYFDSAIHRLAAAAERLNVVPYRSTSGPALLVLAKRDVNKQKHHAEGILLRGREVDSLEDAATALELLVDECRTQGIA